MNEQKNTKVNVGEELKWNKFTEHREVFNQELLSATEADGLGVSVSSVLRERIELGGIVLPHYHDVAEVIHITKGKVRLLKNGEWTSYKEGDTFLVPKGVVHSVANDDTEPTEQVSIFLPVSDDVENEGFKSHMVDVEA
ncbi:cupin domain-containing protein [Virgibacillus halodenitrificans]|uniref:cupin domain-containing protein n=1 Tax=Virgibacillus halodenitrificans TaxID=1482 RepID=UPI0002E2284F|nr:cupin domain-containing protein [Virgibacillus halodenitrificans]MEC2159555.1 cupin domain-containing protein [Virgibacillus halodenitrificans]